MGALTVSAVLGASDARPAEVAGVLGRLLAHVGEAIDADT